MSKSWVRLIAPTLMMIYKQSVTNGHMHFTCRCRLHRPLGDLTIVLLVSKANSVAEQPIIVVLNIEPDQQVLDLE